jgi:MoaA/NifB/PqqE/SkfB family radical SAM enzyme
VVTKYNQDYIPKILKEAEKYGVSISFQPVAKYLKELLPNTTKYKKAINFLIDQKRKGNKHINQSISILKHISKWPNENKISCAAGIIYCRIDPEGYVAPCNMIYQDKKVDELNAAKVGFKQAFNNMPNIGCKDCWHHSRLDLNFIYNLDIPTILDVAKNQ